MLQSKDQHKKSIAVFHKRGGIVRTSEAMRAGIHPRTLYEMLGEGVIEKLSRGLYRLADLPPLGNPDLVSVSKRVPNGVICLISALSFHEITTQIPHEVHLAVSRNAQVPRIDYPPVRIFRFSGSSYSEGIEQTKVDDVSLRIYSPAKTLADCFKYRNKIGLDVAIEALKLYRGTKRFSVDEVMYFARACRVEKVMRPYLEAIL
ncbi:MAG: type IV toxin-antitoxin system AbiEi family antitoxin domain-containing protein [Proteobacteria bacterium]|nr:type IV toxin-antitoxin system AbiEi family antitoxin domain-containing protein [Pseudomonadota bacterium]